MNTIKSIGVSLAITFAWVLAVFLDSLVLNALQSSGHESGVVMAMIISWLALMGICVGMYIAFYKPLHEYPLIKQLCFVFISLAATIWFLCIIIPAYMNGAGEVLGETSAQSCTAYTVLVSGFMFAFMFNSHKMVHKAKHRHHEGDIEE